MEFIKLYLIAAISFLALDSVWLGLAAPKFYKDNIGHLMAKKPNFTAAGLFYILFVAGLVYFVIQPAVSGTSWQEALINGAFFGLLTYGTYDLTSQAVIKDWPWRVTAADLAWGTTVTSAVSIISYGLYQLLFM